MPNRLVSTATLKAWLGIASSDTQHDQLLSAQEARAVATIEQSAGRYFGPEQAGFRETLTGGRPALWLRDDPKDGTLLLERWNGSGGWDAFEASTYELEGRRIHYITGGGLAIGLTGRSARPLWPGSHRSIRATYTRGYPEDGGPGDIQQLVIDMVAGKFRARGREGIQSESGVSKRITYTGQDLKMLGFEEIVSLHRNRRL